MPNPTAPPGSLAFCAHAAAGLAGLCLLFWCPTSQAGRPLTVDDANVNDPGAGHVELWHAHQPGTSRVWTIAPAVGLVDDVELGAALARDRASRTTTSAVQAKVRWTPSQEQGCNVGSVFGLAHASGGGGNTPYVNGLLTCNRGAWSLHANLGATRAPQSPTLPTWGLALERPWGAFTLHAEAFGQRHAKPTLQLGGRTELAPGWQIDATVGRLGGHTLWSVGSKFSF